MNINEYEKGHQMTEPDTLIERAIARGDVFTQALLNGQRLHRATGSRIMSNKQYVEHPGSNASLRTSDHSFEQRVIDGQRLAFIAKGGVREVQYQAPRLPDSDISRERTTSYYAPSLASSQGAEDGWIHGRDQARRAIDGVLEACHSIYSLQVRYMPAVHATQSSEAPGGAHSHHDVVPSELVPA
jgi:hypothetical protein